MLTKLEGHTGWIGELTFSRDGRLLAERGWEYYTLFDVTYRPDCLTVPELETAFRETVQAVFSPPAAARRSEIRREIWKNARSDRERPIAARLNGS